MAMKIPCWAEMAWLATNTDVPKARRQAEVMNINDFNHEVDHNNERIITEPTFASNQPTIAASSMNQYKSAII